MEIILKGSSMICPAQDTPKQTQWISNLDMVMTMYHFPLVYFYKPNGSSDFFKSQVLKEALSKTLVPFYPLAGRLGTDENGRIQIICNGEGALFIEAETTSAIDDFGDFAPSSKLRQLVPTLDYSADISTHPLVISQVTTFKCGGVCLGIGIHHTLADGTSVFAFINSWSDIARGLSLGAAPLIDRTLLRARVPPTPKFHHVEYDSSPSLNASISNSESNPKPLSVSTFRITKDQIHTLKAKSIKDGRNTTHNILAAYIWRCASKARGLLDDQATKLYIPTNGRSRLCPPLPSGYLGNVLFTTATIALSGNLQSEPFMNTIDRVQKAIEKMDNEYLRSALDYLEKLPNVMSVRHGAHTFKSPNLYIINWMRLPIHDADFGWGRPIYVGPANVVHEGKIYLLPSPTDDGSLSLVACLQTSHMELFRKHLYQAPPPLRWFPTTKILSIFASAIALQVTEEMEINVKGSSLICPAQDTPKERQWISNLDEVMTTYHVLLLYFYKPNGSSDFFKAQVLKEALSKTLVPFYPMAGRLGRDGSGRLEIECNAEGVLWIEAETTSAIDDLGEFVPSLKLRQLVPTVDYSKDTSSYPLVMAQVTTFKCGGVSLGIGTHHTLADGTSCLHFINSWSDTARGLSQIRVVPIIDRTLLRARVPPTPRFHHAEYDPPPSLSTSTSIFKLDPNPKHSYVSVFKITLDQLNTLKAKSFNKENKATYSTYTILAAHIWRCAIKARGLSDDQPTKLYMPTNGRPRLHPPLPSSYLGNAMFTASLTALSGHLQSEPFINTIERIHGALKRMDNEYLRSALDYLQKLPDITAARRGPQTFQCPNLNIINWMRLPIHDANFGWGRPIYMGPANVVHEGKIYLLPSPTNDGSLSLVACLETSHMKLFQKHLYEGLMSFDKIKARY
ncbi:hypothetical protein REPUB_Repub18cG0158200 [Reevesia pubescens]